ncbi:cytidine deaminase-like protein [Halteromyces radiatus]|uniref:cytidine deaminase-like protein n=1 Tax=Halteromyces radiatus TaxID=101107 RepID=UPI002220D91C|nr:cytidine deaminase-like protein [Halteromyces radiatus]KAI8084772.1 cytidine deaminase-like protein [Halteromyces radiatus]
MSSQKEELFIPRSEWPFTEVLPEEYTRTLETTQVYVTTVEPKSTNQLLKFIQKYLPPLQQLEHCKRIKRSKQNPDSLVLTTILCTCDSMDLSSLKNLATQHNIDIDPQQIGVPRYPPKNKRQFEQWNPVWPVTYREDPRQHPKWTQQDLDLIQDHMRQLMTATIDHDSSCLDVRARIVDPKSNTVLAQATDTRHLGHPLHHAIMNCIDLVAQKERQNKQQQKDEVDGLKRKHMDDDNALDDNINDRSTTYLCSGYDMYVTHEPCAMCAMALVHSRITRVFYSVPTKTGCLGTLYHIHSHSSLNHHYKTFKDLLLNDTARIPFTHFPDPLDA